MVVYPKRRLLMIPGPTNVPDRVSDAMVKAMVNHRSETFSEVLKSITEKSRYLFQTATDPVTLSASGTGGVEAAVMNLIRPGDKAVVTVYGEFGERLAEVVEIAGGTAVRVKAEFGDAPSYDAVKAAVEANRGLKAVYVIHNETSTGTAFQDVQKVAKLAKDNGAFMVVDAVSSLGGYAIPVDSWGIDICVTASQKCLAAPPGIALVSVSKDVVEYLKKSPPMTRYFDLGRALQFLARWETPFTPVVPVCYALDEALSMLMEETLQKRVERHTRLAAKLYRSLSVMGLNLFAKQELRSNTVAAAMYPAGIDDRKFRGNLSEEHDVVIAGGFGNLNGKVFRVGSMGDVSDAAIFRTAMGIALTLSKLGYKVDTEAVLGVLQSS